MGASGAQFNIRQGDLDPVLGDTLLGTDGLPYDLSGVESITLNLRSLEDGSVRSLTAEALTPSTAGKVNYDWASGDTDTAGEFDGYWLGTFASRPISFSDANNFRLKVIPKFAAPAANVTAISDLYSMLRHLLGDQDPCVQQYTDATLMAAVQTMVRMGKANTATQVYTLTADRLFISPMLADANALALLIYETVLSFVAGRARGYSYRTRALSESFGDWRTYTRELHDNIYGLRNGDMFASMSNYQNWLTVVLGQNVFESGLVALPPVTAPTLSGVVFQWGWIGAMF